MFVLIGIVVVVVSVVAGFTIAGGNIVLLIQVSEFITIGGAAIGSLLIATPLSLLKKILGTLPKILKSSKNTKEDYLQMLKGFSDLFLIAQREGLLAIEKHIENPEKSEILSKNKKFIELNKQSDEKELASHKSMEGSSPWRRMLIYMLLCTVKRALPGRQWWNVV